MTNIRAFREIAKVGKSFIKSITGICENTIEQSTVRDYSLCSTSCPFYTYILNANSVDELPGYCKKHCDSIKRLTNNNETSVTKYTNRLSKSQIKQLLYYHFICFNENGIITNASISEAAEYLNCTTKTVLNNIQRFAELGYIYYTKINEDIFNILLCEYKSYHLEKEQGGTGYISVAKEFFNEIIKLQDVNVLRIELRKILKSDNDKVKTQYTKIDDTLSEFKFNDLRLFLPTHLNYKKAIEEAVTGATDAFYTRIKDNIIQFTLNEEYNADVLKNIKEVEFSNSIKDYCNVHNIYLDTKLKTDLIQMSLEYSLECTLKALDIYREQYQSNNQNIENLGGLVRNIIKFSFIQKISA